MTTCRCTNRSKKLRTRDSRRQVRRLAQERPRDDPHPTRHLSWLTLRPGASLAIPTRSLPRRQHDTPNSVFAGAPRDACRPERFGTPGHRLRLRMRPCPARLRHRRVPASRLPGAGLLEGYWCQFFFRRKEGYWCQFFFRRKKPTPITLRCCRGLLIAPSPAPEHKKPPTLDRWISAMHYRTIVLELFQDLNPALHEQPRKDSCMRKILGPPIRLEYHDWIEQ